MKIVIVVAHDTIFLIFIVIIIGNIMAISMSKIRNRIAIKKNCKENGDRAFDLGSNPHSNGDIFSRSKIEVFEITVHNIIRNVEIIIATSKDNIIFIITFSYIKIF